ncbi:FG-nucleoporin nsp1 [Linderina macrospora]|uniref:FG-nucleoporin nsp1 n=1 Tax=Linderina macrospora TaxID=4868 RepID=A0ACC1J198_9FUNG|nr:FG-nucleoporin nsp1 [Linderina macrospora]
MFASANSAASSAAATSAAAAATTASSSALANPTIGTGLGGSGFKLSTTPAEPATAPKAEVAADLTKPVALANKALKGKTLEEIAQTWTDELALQTREFHTQAATVSYWDRALVKQGNRITELYEATMAVEAEQAALDQSLEHMEGQQAALNELLDTYEGRVRDLVKDTVVRSNGPMRTADEERTELYKSAENLNTQMDELARRLTDLVGAVNSVSNAEPPASSDNDGQRAAQDPFVQIVNVLNSHLTSMEWIDEQTSRLQERVRAAHRVNQQVTLAQAQLSGSMGGDILGDGIADADEAMAENIRVPGGFNEQQQPPPNFSMYGTLMPPFRLPQSPSSLSSLLNQTPTGRRRL